MINGTESQGGQPSHEQLHQQRHQRPQKPVQLASVPQQALCRRKEVAIQVNNSIINKLLLGSDRDSLSILKDILTHLLHIVDLKGINVYILSILTKVISFIKIIEEEQLKSEEKLFEGISYNQEMTDILYHIIDIIFLFKNKHK